MKHPWRRKLPIGAALFEEAQRLGISLKEIYKDGGVTLDEPELQRRVMAAWADRRSGWLGLLAFVSAIASALSAAVAWYAVAHR